MNKRKRIGYPILEAVLSLLAVLLIAIGFSDNYLSKGFATANSISRVNSDTSDYIVFSTVMRSLDDDSNISGNYLRSFRNTPEFVRTLSYFDEEGDVAKLKVQSNGQDYSDFAICDMGTYSNSERFENLDISLLRDVPRSQELNSYGTNGFVFVPDYLADQMIENSGGDLKNYDDLVPDYDELSQEEISSLLDKYALSITNEAGETLRYKISNIFRVNGFNEAYLNGREAPRETSIGATLESFFGHYMFSPSQSLVRNAETALFNFVENKQFSIHYDLFSVTSVRETTKLELTCYLHEADGYEKNVYYTNMIRESFIAHQPNFLYTLLLVAGFLFLASSIILPFVFKAKFLVEPRTYLWNIVFLLFIALVLNILEMTLGSVSYAFLTFNNVLCGGSILVLLAFSAYFYLSEKKKWRKGL